jgi:hypothetical protein
MPRFIFNLCVSIIFFSATILSCGSNPLSNDQILSEPPISYDSFLKEIVIKKDGIDSGDWTQAGQLLFQTLNNDIPTYWTGTKWDFNGTTQTPSSGTIACGYFLTTTMQQTGFEIKRVWMAQQASSTLIKAYCTNVKVTSSVSSIVNYLKSQPDISCFIIGLDFHTGFITKDSSDYYFIHSNYIGDEGVIKEKVEVSEALANNAYFMIGSLTKRKDHLQHWMGW